VLTAVVVVVAAVALVVPLGGLALLRRPPARSARAYPGVTEVRVRLGAGRVELAEDARADARLDVVARRRPGLVLPLIRQVGGVLDVDARGSQARLSARLPRGTRARVEVREGEISLWGSAGDLELVTATGAITARELSGGRVVARAGAGDVVLHFDGPPGEATGLSETGNVRLVVPEAPYAVDVAAGDISRVNIVVPHDPGAPHRLTARSRAGSVTVLPAASPARL
jgi:hypothetical protein